MTTAKGCDRWTSDPGWVAYLSFVLLVQRSKTPIGGILRQATFDGGLSFQIVSKRQLRLGCPVQRLHIAAFSRQHLHQPEQHVRPTVSLSCPIGAFTLALFRQQLG